MKDELTFEQILDMLQGGARNFIGGGGVMGFGTSAEKRAGKVAEDNFLTNIMGGNTATNPTTTTDDLSPVNMRSMVNTNNASGTDPTMMVNPDTAVRNLGIGVDGNTETYGFTGDTLTPEAMNQFRAREGITAMTPEEQNVYMQLDDSQRPAFLEALRQNKISQYEAENFDRMRM